jgi:hypothetical protein
MIGRNVRKFDLPLVKGTSAQLKGSAAVSSTMTVAKRATVTVTPATVSVTFDRGALTNFRLAFVIAVR